MSRYPLIASLAPALDVDPAARWPAPLRLEQRFEGRALACPSSWSELAARECALVGGKPLRVWRVADLVVLRGEAQSSGLGVTGIRPLPLPLQEVEALVPYLDAEAAPHEIALAVAGLLGLLPILSEEEARHVTDPSAVRAPAPATSLERWRAPYRDEGSVVFQAGPDPLVEVRVDFVQGWVDLEELSAGWAPAALVGGVH